MSETPGRNDPCPCGSGKKYKRCHGRAVIPAPTLPTPGTLLPESEHEATIDHLHDWLATKKPGSIRLVEKHFFEGADNRTFKEEGRNPDAWAFNARRLKRAAGLLLPDQVNNQLVLKAVESGFAERATKDLTRHMEAYSFVDLVGMMLLGMSFESIFKGLLIAQDPSLVEDKALSGKLNTHNLKALAERLEKTTGIALTASEIDLLHPMLTRLVVWAGRYPIPREHSDMVSMFRQSSQATEQIEALWEKLMGLLKAMVRTSPTSPPPAPPHTASSP